MVLAALGLRSAQVTGLSGNPVLMSFQLCVEKALTVRST